MDTKYTVKLTKLIQDLKLEIVSAAEDIDDVLIESPEINRPGLPLTGFFEFYDSRRIEIIGLVEMNLLEKMDEMERRERVEEFFKRRTPALIISRNMEPFKEFIEFGKKYNVTILRSKTSTSSLMSAVIAFLNLELAPRMTCHGVLVEVYGEGILLRGESGVGKSETAVELVKRGHRLVADDAVEIKRVSDKSLVGTAPEIIRHFIELRGIGIVDVKELFGVGAVKATEKIDLVINMEPWQDKKVYDRLGISETYDELLGLKVPSLVIPVKPGRNLAIIIEIAAMNNRQRRMGYNAAEVLNEKLLSSMSTEEEEV